jgi:hypothetical protein
MDAIEGQSWFCVQDQEPGNSCLVYLRAWQGIGVLQVLATSPDSAYSRCLLLKLQADIEARLADLGMMEKDRHLRQLPCGYLRDQIASMKLGMLDTVELEHTDQASRVHKAATSRESACSSLRELELRAGKDLADKGRVKKRGA